MSAVWGLVLPQAQAHAELRPARFVVAPSPSGVNQLVLRLRLSGLGDKCEQVAFYWQKPPLYWCGAEKREPRPVPKCRRANKPKAQKERSLSLFARSDDILNRSQFCVRGSACGSNKCKSYFLVSPLLYVHAIRNAINSA